MHRTSDGLGNNGAKDNEFKGVWLCGLTLTLKDLGMVSASLYSVPSQPCLQRKRF